METGELKTLWDNRENWDKKKQEILDSFKVRIGDRIAVRFLKPLRENFSGIVEDVIINYLDDRESFIEVVIDETEEVYRLCKKDLRNFFIIEIIPPLPDFKKVETMPQQGEISKSTPESASASDMPGSIVVDKPQKDPSKEEILESLGLHEGQADRSSESEGQLEDNTEEADDAGVSSGADLDVGSADKAEVSSLDDKNADDKGQETLEEKEATEEIEAMPEKEKEKLYKGFFTWNYAVKEFKSKHIKNALNWGLEKTGDKKNLGVLKRVLSAERAIYERDILNARKQAMGINKGGFFKKAGKESLSTLALAGNITRAGRMLYDTYQSFYGIARHLNPFRHVMAGSVFLGRRAEMLKEARIQIANEKTRIEENDAWDEAFAVREQIKLQTGKNDVKLTAEDFSKYQNQEILRSLENRLRGKAVKFWTLDASIGIKSSIEKTITKIENINGNDKLSSEQKEEKIALALGKQKKFLREMDALVDNAGMVDLAGFAAGEIEKGLKIAQVGLIIETWAMLYEKAVEIKSHLGEIASDIKSYLDEKTPDLVEKASSYLDEKASDIKSYLNEKSSDIKSYLDLEKTSETPSVPETPSTSPKELLPETLSTEPSTPESSALGTPTAPSIKPIPALEQVPVAIKIEEGGNVWNAAHSLIGRGSGKITAHEFNEAWSNPKSGAMINEKFVHIRYINLTHKNDNLVFVPRNGNEPAHFEIKDYESDKYKIGRREYLKSEKLKAIIEAKIGEGTGKTPIKIERTPGHKYPFGAHPATEIPQELTPAEKLELEKAKQVYEETKNALTGAVNTGNEIYDPNDPFPDIPHEQNLWLQGNPEFAKNPFHLSGEQLIQALNAGRQNTIDLFKNDPSIWNILETRKAGKTLGYTGNNQTVVRLSKYLDLLKDWTGLQPKYGLFGTEAGAESSESYVARAFQKIIQDERLGEFEEQIKSLKNK